MWGLNLRAKGGPYSTRPRYHCVALCSQQVLCLLMVEPLPLRTALPTLGSLTVPKLEIPGNNSKILLSNSGYPDTSLVVHWGFKTPCFQSGGVQVLSLVRELRSCMLLITTIKLKFKKEWLTSSPPVRGIRGATWYIPIRMGLPALHSSWAAEGAGTMAREKFLKASYSVAAHSDFTSDRQWTSLAQAKWTPNSNSPWFEPQNVCFSPSKVGLGCSEESRHIF